jgi:hypothetical protein
MTQQKTESLHLPNDLNTNLILEIKLVSECQRCVERSAHLQLLGTRKVLDYNRGPRSGYIDWGHHWPPQSLQEKSEWDHDHLLSKGVQVTIH